MMSLHSATHSSQMNTRGPEISLRTSRRRFPQNEQWKSSIKEEYCIRTAPRQAPSRGNYVDPRRPWTGGPGAPDLTQEPDAGSNGVRARGAARISKQDLDIGRRSPLDVIAAPGRAGYCTRNMR